MQGIRGVYKASFGPLRARARVYRALALCVLGASQPIIRDIPSSGVPATLALPPLEPSHPTVCLRDGPLGIPWLYACCTEERLGHGMGTECMARRLCRPC
jgi:hypothetical protein